MPSVKIYNVNSHENKEKTLKLKGVFKLLTGSVQRMSFGSNS